MSSEPRPLRDLADESAFTAADVAFLAGLDEATVSRLWNEYDWLERVRGPSLQALISVVPGVGDYVCSHSLEERRARLVDELRGCGLDVDLEVFRELVVNQRVPEPHLGNALQGIVYVMTGDRKSAAEQLARCWGLNRDQALACVFAPPDRDGLLPDGRGLLVDPNPALEAAGVMARDLAAQANSFHATLAYACLAHHLGRTTGDAPVEIDTNSRALNRHTGLAWRSMMMGRIVETNDPDLTGRYLQMLDRNAALARIEEWALPGQTRDIPVTPALYLPSRQPLPRTAKEVLYEIDTYNDAYFRYLVTGALPVILRRDPTFGLRAAELSRALQERLERVGDPETRKPASSLVSTLKASHDF